MKTLLYTLIIISITTHLNGQIDFRDGNWAEMLEMAKTENKVIFVDAYAVWCGPCKMMDKQVFTQASVGDFFNENFINAKIDMEKGEGRTLQREYQVTAYPTLLFINKNGELIHRAVGFQDADRLINSGKIALRKDNDAEEFATRYESGERDPEFVLEYMKQLNKADKPTEKIALEYLNEKPNIDDRLGAFIAFTALENVDSRLYQTILKGKKFLQEEYSVEEIDRKLEKAAQNTINTAVQFKSPNVFDQLILDLKKMDMTPSHLRSLERSYYVQVKDEAAYRKSISMELESEHSDPARLAMEIYQSFPESKSMLQYGRSIFDPKFPMALTMDNYVTGLSLAIGLQDFVYMEQIFETMKMKLDMSSREQSQVEGLYDKAKKYLGMQLEKN